MKDRKESEMDKRISKENKNSSESREMAFFDAVSCTPDIYDVTGTNTNNSLNNTPVNRIQLNSITQANNSVELNTKYVSVSPHICGRLISSCPIIYYNKTNEAVNVSQDYSITGHRNKPVSSQSQHTEIDLSQPYQKNQSKSTRSNSTSHLINRKKRKRSSVSDLEQETQIDNTPSTIHRNSPSDR